MEEIKDLPSIVDGEHFIRAMITATKKNNVSDPRLKGNQLTSKTGKLLYVDMKWVEHGSEVELLLDNSNTHISGIYNTPYVLVDLELATKTGWLIEKK